MATTVTVDTWLTELAKKGQKDIEEHVLNEAALRMQNEQAEQDRIDKEWERYLAILDEDLPDGWVEAFVVPQDVYPGMEPMVTIQLPGDYTPIRAVIHKTAFREECFYKTPTYFVLNRDEDDGRYCVHSDEWCTAPTFAAAVYEAGRNFPALRKAEQTADSYNDGVKIPPYIQIPPEKPFSLADIASQLFATGNDMMNQAEPGTVDVRDILLGSIAGSLNYMAVVQEREEQRRRE